VAVSNHVIKSREDLLVRQVSHCSEQNQSIGWRCIFFPLSGGTSLSEIRHEFLLAMFYGKALLWLMLQNPDS
jgi:hypothetical protein